MGAVGGAAPRHVPLVGRDALLAELADELQAGRSVTLVAPAGTGSSRLLAELRARHDGAVLELEGSLDATDVPLGAAITALPDLAALQGVTLRQLRARAGAILAGLAGDGQLLITVDEACSLDPVTALGVAEVRTASWARVVAVVRAGDVRPDAVERLVSDGRSRVVHVPPIADVEVARLAAAVLGAPLAPSLEAEVVAAAAGRPFVVVELLEGAREIGAIEEVDRRWHRVGELPSERVGGLLEARVARLDPAAAIALDLIALGAPLAYSALTQLVEARHLEALSAAELVAVEPDGAGQRVVVRHPSYRRVLVDRLTPDRRRGLLERLVEVVRRGADDAADRLRVIAWEVELGRGEGPAVERAARFAAELGDHRLAARLGRAAIERGGGYHGHLVLGLAATALGELEDAASHLGRASRAAVTDAERLFAIQARAQALAFGAGRWSAARSLLAREAGSDPATERRGELQAMAAVLAAASGELDRWVDLDRWVRLDGSAASDETATSTDGGATPRGRYLAGVASGLAAYAALDRERLRRADAVVSAAGEHARRVLPLGAALVTGRAILDEPGPVAARIAAATAVLDASPGGPRGAEAGWWRFVVSCLQFEAGAVTAAIDGLRDAAAITAQVDPVRIRPLVRAELAWAEATAGAATAALQTLAELAEEQEASRGLALRCGLVRALATAQLGDVELGAELAHAAALAACRSGHLRLARDAVHLGVRLGRGAAGSGLLDTGPLAVRDPATVAVRAHAVAVANDDADALDAVAVAFVRGGSRIHAAEAAAQAAAIGPTPSRSARAAGLLTGCPGLATPAVAGIAPVDVDERLRGAAVAALDGATNEEIAAGLAISPRSVERHLGELYRAFGVSGRRELRTLYDPTVPPFAP